MQGIKSAKLEIANLALLIPCMDFEVFCIDALNVPLVNFFKNVAQDLGQFRSKSAFS
jgi:hypothetical protein